MKRHPADSTTTPLRRVTPKEPGPIARAIARMQRRDQRVDALGNEVAALKAQLAKRAPAKSYQNYLDEEAGNVREQARAVLAATAPVTAADLERLERAAETTRDKASWLAYQTALRRRGEQLRAAAAERGAALRRELASMPAGSERSAFYKQHKQEMYQ